MVHGQFDTKVPKAKLANTVAAVPPGGTYDCYHETGHGSQNGSVKYLCDSISQAPSPCLFIRAWNLLPLLFYNSSITFGPLASESGVKSLTPGG